MTFKLNMSDNVAASSGEYELPPTGRYVVMISDITSEEVQQGKNTGKPFWRTKLTIEEGKYQGLPVYTNIMLWGEAYALKWLCDAVHPEYVVDKEIHLPTAPNGAPDPTSFIGQKCSVKGTKFLAGTKKKNGEIRERDEFNVVFQKLDSAKDKSGSGLPLPS
jgi:hypothetical protein